MEYQNQGAETGGQQLPIAEIESEVETLKVQIWMMGPIWNLRTQCPEKDRRTSEFVVFARTRNMPFYRLATRGRDPLSSANYA
jgi:hypothetical protein